MKTMIGCAAVVYDDEGKVLISQRSSIKRKFPLLWENAGGALEDGETPEGCVRREIKEEIGCELKDLELFSVEVFITEENERHVLITYTGKVAGEIVPNCEVEKVEWITYADIDKYDFYADICKQRIIDFFLKHS